MLYFATGLSRLESIMNLVGVLILFLLILFAAYYTSRWVGKATFLQQNNKNIQLIESFRLNQTKYIQIVKIGTRYVALGISKEQIVVLCELAEEELKLMEDLQANTNAASDFKDILAKLTKKKK